MQCYAKNGCARSIHIAGVKSTFRVAGAAEIIFLLQCRMVGRHQPIRQPKTEANIAHWIIDPGHSEYPNGFSSTLPPSSLSPPSSPFLTLPQFPHLQLPRLKLLGADTIMAENILACPKCHLLFPHYFDAYDHYRYSPAHEAEVQNALEHTSSGLWVNSKRKMIEKMFIVAQIPLCLTQQQVVWLQTKILEERLSLRAETKLEELPIFDYVTLHSPIRES